MAVNFQQCLNLLCNGRKIGTNRKQNQNTNANRTKQRLLFTVLFQQASQHRPNDANGSRHSSFGNHKPNTDLTVSNSPPISCTMMTNTTIKPAKVVIAELLEPPAHLLALKGGAVLQVVHHGDKGENAVLVALAVAYPAVK